jgi:uncharacterized protein (TIGR02677 family)
MHSSDFNLTDPVSLVNYLSDSTKRTKWYRAIMQVLLQAHRDYRTPLTEDAICQEVQQFLGLTYSLEQCINDLDTLKEWKNVTSYYDDNRLNTLESLLHHPQLYQATPAALLLEECISTIVQVASSTQGALHQSDLEQLFQLLQQLDQDLVSPLQDLRFDYAERITGQWKRIFELWDSFAKSAAQYLNTIAEPMQQPGTQLERYQAYKNNVVHYVQTFARALVKYSHGIREILLRWSEQTKEETLFACFLLFHQSIQQPALLQTRQELEDLLLHQITRFSHWFEEGSNATRFQQIALTEVAKVVHKASVLSLGQWSAFNLPTQLQTVGHYLFDLEDANEAQRIFMALFTNAHPLHFDAGLPSPCRDITNQLPCWLSPPLAICQLQSLHQQTKRRSPLSHGVPQNSQEDLQQLRTQDEHEDENQEHLLLAQFLHHQLDLGTICFSYPPLRVILEQVLDECLSQPDFVHDTTEGNSILLLNPENHDYIALACHDGILYLPHYQLMDKSPQGSNDTSEQT